MTYRKIPKHIEIIRSSKSALSSLGAKSCDAIYGLLKEHYATVTVSIVNDLADLNQVIAKRPDLVFIGLKYVPGVLPDSKVWISEYLDQHGISYTGSPRKAIELEQSKPLAKQRMLAAGVKTARYAVVKNGDTFDVTNSALRFPLFIKPSDLGAGKGIDENSVVQDVEELNAKVASLAATHSAAALIEEFLPGREYSVAVLKEEYSEKLMVMPLELVPEPNIHGHRVLSHELKSAPLETPVFPVLDPLVRTALIDLARRAFITLEARDYGRIDIRMDEAGVPHFLEANLIPCLIEGSGNFPKACVMNIGMEFEAMLLHIVRLGLARCQESIAERRSIATHHPLAAPTSI